jgi:hypothetical protein
VLGNILLKCKRERIESQLLPEIPFSEGSKSSYLKAGVESAINGSKSVLIDPKMASARSSKTKC